MDVVKDHSHIYLKKVKVHNLKSVDLVLPKNELIVFTGVSGSGKSSLAFDTLYVEGQRRYVESLSSHARRQMDELHKPDLEKAEGLSPSISIEQKTAGRNPRSTVGTLTEIYDYLRVLYARVGTAHCPVSHDPVKPQSLEQIVRAIENLGSQEKIILLAPYAKEKKAEFKEDFQDLLRKGYTRARIDGTFVDLSAELSLDGSLPHDVDIVVDRICIDPSQHSRLVEAVTYALELGRGLCSALHLESRQETLFSTYAYSAKSGLSYPPLEPHDFSFNSPSGMCPHCQGLGQIRDFNLALVIDETLSIAEDCCRIAPSYQTVRFGNIYDNLASAYHFSVNTPWKLLSQEAKRVFLYGVEAKWMRMRFVHPTTGASWIDYVQWKGALFEAARRYAEAKSDSYKSKMHALMSEQICPVCKGERLKPYPAATLFQGKKISELTAMTLKACWQFFDHLRLSPYEQLIAQELVQEIKNRLQFLLDVGLHYLSLDRTSPTLSGGEAQRVRLASQIGCGLVGITYILDEPSIGLHPRDNQKLIATLKKLKEMGNTVIVVEHDEETIEAANRIVDFGKGAGSEGGTILVNGSLGELLTHKESLTGAYLSGRSSIACPTSRRPHQGPTHPCLLIKKAAHHNLKDVTVSIPLGLFVAVTGVSGSGKSSLISDILYPALANALHKAHLPVGQHLAIEGREAIHKVIGIDQSPIGRNPRSNPATYIKLFDEIRDLFSKLQESASRGFKAGRFSFNVKEGSCTECGGLGQVKIDMDFLEDAWVTCSLCQGRRFDQETLSILYKDKNIHDVLEMSVKEALDFFSVHPAISSKLKTLSQVGLDYLKLGQSSTTLSGGEAQRIKLAKELTRPSSGKTVYILDEPTTGLHFHDVKQLIEVLQALVDKGNSLLVIEHNMDVVKTADWIIDMGPEGGQEGGCLMAEGPPESIAEKNTPTGLAVKEALLIDRAKKTREFLAKKKTKKKAEKRASPFSPSITVVGANQNNLKDVGAKIPRGKITICSGPSGSGKSSFAFETVYAEGQRRYAESLSPYARQFVKQMAKPKVRDISGLSPSIAIEQKISAGNPRSTVGTLTEIYDYLRLLYARVGIAHCPLTGERLRAISKEYVAEKLLAYPEKTHFMILAPLEMGKQEKIEDRLQALRSEGFAKIRLNGVFYDLEESETIQASFDPKRKNALFLLIDRLAVAKKNKNRFLEAIENAARLGKKKLLVMQGDKEMFFNLSFCAESTGKSYPEITPQTFAFNTKEGMCPDCQGIGTQYSPYFRSSVSVFDYTGFELLQLLCKDTLDLDSIAEIEHFFREKGVDIDQKLSQFSEENQRFFLQGNLDEPYLEMPSGLRLRWLGINSVIAKAGKSGQSALKEAASSLLEEQICPSCQGSRLNPLARAVRVEGASLPELCQKPAEQALEFIQSLLVDREKNKSLSEVRLQIQHRLAFLCQLGLHYLSIDRSAPTLSGGEAQRIRLARQLGSGLTGVLYVLDEPTIGLHPKDNAQLNQALEGLKNMGNTLLLVEHDPLTLLHADYLLDFGPGSGDRGGHIIAEGSIPQIMKNKKSLTGLYLSGKKSVSCPKHKRPFKKGFISIEGLAKHNLKNISVQFPIGSLSCLTGVSGSGKSTLLEELLEACRQKKPQESQVLLRGASFKGLEAFEKVISIDQNPIGTTSRSDVGTYVDILGPMRLFFSSLATAKAKGLQSHHFSYNHRKGMCPSCFGLGYKRVTLQFLPPLKVPCEECRGMRLSKKSLEITYKGKSFGEYLNSTIDEVKISFEHHPKIVRQLDTLIHVGLGYLKLGQESASLSGGEAQRLKLSKELSRRSKGKTLYLLDEPTTGLHFEDVEKLLVVLHSLVDKGNTMIIIEHNVDVIKNADYLVELGPQAGEKGGYLISHGPFEEAVKNPLSQISSYLC